MKLLIILGLLIVVTGVCFLGVTAPVAKSLSKCFDRYSLFLISSLETAKNEKWSKEKLCLNGKDAVNTELSCYKEVENEKGQFRTSLTWSILKIVRPNSSDLDRDGLVKSLNNSCKQFPASLIQE